jgi:hypothetical protein
MVTPGVSGSSEKISVVCWMECRFRLLGSINPLQGLLVAGTFKLLPEALLTAW